MMQRNRTRWTAVTAAGLILLGAQRSSAQNPEEFYAGKTVTLIVGFEVGGGYDLYTRLLARHYGKYLNGATFVVQNMTGAGSLRAANYIFNVAPKDGTMLGMVGGGIAFEPLFGNSQAQFRAEEFSWVGSENSEVSTCQIWHIAPMARFEDALTAEIAVGGTGTGADSNVFPRALNAFTGTKFKVISGYTGTAPVFLAMERGEVNGICGIYWSSAIVQHGDWIAQGKMKPLVQLAIEKHPDHPDVPLAIDFARSPADRAALELVFAPMKFARPMFGPPGIPADRLAHLRRAFDRTMNDPEFRADAAKLNLEVGPLPGAQIDVLLKRFYRSPPEVIKRVSEARR